MALYHCDSCHHEYEGSSHMESVYCDWCGGKGLLLLKKTGLEELINKEFDELITDVKEIS